MDDSLSVRSKAKFLALVEILMAKKVITEEEVKSMRSISDLTAILVDRGVLDIEEVNVLTISFGKFMTEAKRVFKEPQNKKLLLEGLRSRYGKEHSKAIDLIERLSNG